jgi:voltage-gated potassium channel Kch
MLNEFNLHKFHQKRLLPLIRSTRALIWKHVLWSVLFSVTSVWLMTSFLVYRFEHNAAGSNIASFGEALWWGIVTLLTVGYGDKYPVTTEGRMVASVLMITGVACVGVITAKISSIFLERALRDGRGFVDSNQLKNHFIICGWNENMEDLLLHILDFNTELSSNHLVIIANSTQSIQDALIANPRLKDLHFITGDHFSEINLRRAAPERARKILILADRTPNTTGQLPTPTEVDARTIMTAMTISNIARGTLVTAEILDPKMDHYLKLANVSEIIYSSEYSRLLLGNATGGTGIANIVFDLLDNRAGAHITSHPLPGEAIGKTYVDTKTALESSHPHLLVIGVLENSGNSHTIKEMALRRAQQTPDMKQLVLNLQSVRELRCNNPIFHPADDHLISEGSMAIVIAKKTPKRKGSENGAAFTESKKTSRAA